jgi:hypothetical protein
MSCRARDIRDAKRTLARRGPRRVGAHAARFGDARDRRVVLADRLEHARENRDAGVAQSRHGVAPDLMPLDKRRERQLHRVHADLSDARHQFDRRGRSKRPRTDS